MEKDGNVERIEKLQKKRQGKKVEEEIKIIQLPLCFEPSSRATPNSFIRSALFSAIQSKDRVRMENVDIESQDGIVVNYSGMQLNQEDLTLWETLVHSSKGKAGTLVILSAHSLLKAMRLNTGGDEHKRLHQGIKRLVNATVEITHNGNNYVGNLLRESLKDENTGYYAIELNPKLIALFGDSMWTHLDWELRLSLRRKPLAQALHAYYSSHRKPFPVKLETLRKLTGSRNSQVASFRRHCDAALKCLKERGFFKDFQIKDDLVSVERAAGQLK
jgi:hypothetical protein